MKAISAFLLSGIFISIFALETLAADNPSALPDSKPVDLHTNPHWRDWIFGGLNFGYSMISTEGSLKDNNKNGFQFNAKLVGSRYFGKWVGDLGVGWFYNRQKGTNSLS